MKEFYSKWDAFAMRTMTYTTARIWGFLYFYDWINKDPRRTPKADYYFTAGALGGIVGGILANPFEIVFTRMQADAMYPDQARRNYKSFMDGFIKVADEGALFRGAIANGLKYMGLISLASGFNDWMKEQSYYFLGPIMATRIAGTALGVVVATAISMPFDTLRTRMHTMRPLPNGEMPYKDTLDCFTKIVRHECNFDKHNNFGSFYTGCQPYFLRLLLICYVS